MALICAHYHIPGDFSPALRACRIWDDGTANPEPALDQFNLVSSGTALRWLLGGLGVFALVGTAAAVAQPEKRTPWAPKQVVFVPPEVANA